MNKTKVLAQTALFAALSTAGLAHAAPTCSAADFPSLTVLDCAGWFDPNLAGGNFGGNATNQALRLEGLNSLSSGGFSGGSFTSSSTVIETVGTATSLTTTLYGYSIIGLHYG
ncbi:MAG: hypothetical protein ACK44L_13280, partial [Burkholderiales bacterium]